MKTIAFVSLLAAGIVLAACATEPREPPPRPFIGTRWQAQLGLPYAGEKPWLRFGDGRLEGFGGCNPIAARYVEDSVGAKAIAIGRIEAGRHGCDAAARRLQEGWLDTLHAVSSYSITGDVLTMSGSGGMLRLRAVPEEAKGFVGTRWIGIVAEGADPHSRPRLEFVSQGRLSGYTGCNVFSGVWKMESAQVRVEGLAMTKRMCVGAAGEIEKRFLAAMATGARGRREGDRLVFTGPQGERFEFEPAAAA